MKPSRKDDDLKGKLYPWIEDEYGPSLFRGPTGWLTLAEMRARESQRERERAEMLRADIESMYR